MPTTMTLTELAEAGETDLGTSDWLEVTQDMVNQFADATLDHQWIHIDVERAKDGPFGGPIAHGFLTLSFLPHLVGQILQVTEVSAGVNYGLDKLRFTSPVPVGGRVRANGRLLETQQKGQGIMARVEVTVEIEGSDRPALVATWLILRYP